MSKGAAFQIPRALRNGINVTFVMLDESLCEIERLTAGQPVDSALHHETNTLSPAQKAYITGLTSRMRETIAGVRETLRLKPDTLDARDAIRSICSVMWQRLADTESGRLRRYGNVPKDLAEYLDPIVKSLSDQTREILDCIKHFSKDQTDH